MKKSTTYTGDDFRTAVFARHPDGRIAARVDSGNLGWWAGGNERAEPSWMDDYDMAEGGFVPVMEAHPITLDALWDAWETAEVADECNEGDILIRLHPEISTALVQVWRSEMTVPMGNLTRILQRAPKPKRPEGAEQLSLLIQQAREASEWADDADAWADWLADRGVCVTGGGDG